MRMFDDPVEDGRRADRQNSNYIYALGGQTATVAPEVNRCLYKLQLQLHIRSEQHRRGHAHGSSQNTADPVRDAQRQLQPS